MTSFIEIPQMGHRGSELPSLYVNVADIISFRATYDNGTDFEIRDCGTEGMSATRHTYLPSGLFLNMLGILAEHPGVRSWTEETKDAWRIPAARRSVDQAEREDASYRRAGVG